MLLGDAEKGEFEAMLRANRCYGAWGRQRAGMVELYALPERRQFPVGVQVWLLGRGFIRRDDPVMGPFWERPMDEVLEVTR